MRSPDLELAEHIEAFKEYLNVQLSAIYSLSDEGHSRVLQKKILLVAMLDCLSHAVYPNAKTHRLRFTQFLANFAGWPEGGNVSLPHLVRVLTQTKEPSWLKLRGFAEERFRAWDSGEIHLLADDPTLDSVSAMWPRDERGNLISKPFRLEMLQHWNLAYAYRNYLVHEFRPPGQPAAIRETGDPYYIAFYLWKPEQQAKFFEAPFSWELHYPLQFLERICKCSLDSAIQYFTEKDRDPTASFSFGSSWLKELG